MPNSPANRFDVTHRPANEIALVRETCAHTYRGSGSFIARLMGIASKKRALFVALTEQVPSGAYDIVDDEPMTRTDVFAAMAHAVGRKRLMVLPDFLMRMVMGVKYADMSRSLRISNRLFKEVSNWKPQVPNARISWQPMVDTEKDRVF